MECNETVSRSRRQKVRYVFPKILSDKLGFHQQNWGQNGIYWSICWILKYIIYIIYIYIILDNIGNVVIVFRRSFSASLFKSLFLSHAWHGYFLCSAKLTILPEIFQLAMCRRPGGVFGKCFGKCKKGMFPNGNVDPKVQMFPRTND